MPKLTRDFMGLVLRAAACVVASIHMEHTIWNINYVSKQYTRNTESNGLMIVDDCAGAIVQGCGCDQDVVGLSMMGGFNAATVLGGKALELFRLALRYQVQVSGTAG
jgi:hypothetical protein